MKAAAKVVITVLDTFRDLDPQAQFAGDLLYLIDRFATGHISFTKEVTETHVRAIYQSLEAYGKGSWSKTIHFVPVKNLVSRNDTAQKYLLGSQALIAYLDRNNQLQNWSQAHRLEEQSIIQALQRAFGGPTVASVLQFMTAASIWYVLDEREKLAQLMTMMQETWLQVYPLYDFNPSGDALLLYCQPTQRRIFRPSRTAS